MKSLTKDEITKLCDERVLFKAEDYMNSKRVMKVRVEGNVLYSSVQGSRPSPYKVEIEYELERNGFISRCSCPAEMAFCKHVIATLLAVQGGSGVKVRKAYVSDEEVEAFLSMLSRDDLIDLVRDHSKRYNDIKRELSLKAARSKGGKIDAKVYISEIDDAVSGYVDYPQMDDFIGELEDVYASVEKLTESFPEESAEILEHYIERCVGHYENCDDSDGVYGEFIDKLMKLHSTVLSRFDCDQKKLAEWIIYHWEHNDNGFGYHLLETYTNALKVEALNILRDKFLSKLKDVERKTTSRNRWEASYEYPSIKEFLLIVYDLLGDDEGFFKLAESGLKDSGDYLVLVDKLVKMGRIDEAISRCEEGVEKSPDKDLLNMLADLYKQKNNPEKELSALEKLFKVTPSEETLEKMLDLAERTGRWKECKARAIRILNREKYWGLLTKIYMKDRNYEDLIGIALNKSCNRKVKEKIARFISQNFPEEAIRTYQEIISDFILEMGNYSYWKATRLLVELRKIYHSQDKEQEWTSYLKALKTKHKLKRNFMAELAKAGL